MHALHHLHAKASCIANLLHENENLAFGKICRPNGALQRWRSLSSHGAHSFFLPQKELENLASNDGILKNPAMENYEGGKSPLFLLFQGMANSPSRSWSNRS